jgi:hypothetical protein
VKEYQEAYAQLVKENQLLSQDNDRRKDTIDDQTTVIRDLQGQLGETQRNLDNEKEAR